MYTVVWYIPFHPVYIYHVSYRKFAPKPTSKGLYEACWTVLMFSKKSYWYNSRREMVPQSAFLRWTSWWYSKDSARMLLSSSSLTNSWVFHAIAKQKFSNFVHELNHMTATCRHQETWHGSTQKLLSHELKWSPSFSSPAKLQGGPVLPSAVSASPSPQLFVHGRCVTSPDACHEFHSQRCVESSPDGQWCSWRLEMAWRWHLKFVQLLWAFEWTSQPCWCLLVCC